MLEPTVITRYFKVDRCEIGYLRCIIESYEGLATISTVDARDGIVSLSAPCFFAEEAVQLVEALKGEMIIEEIPAAGKISGLTGQPDNRGA